MRRVFLLPAAIALLSLIGLVLGLLGTGVFDWLAWLGLASPVLSIVWAATRIRPVSRDKAVR